MYNINTLKFFCYIVIEHTKIILYSLVTIEKEKFKLINVNNTN